MIEKITDSVIDSSPVGTPMVTKETRATIPDVWGDAEQEAIEFNKDEQQATGDVYFYNEAQAKASTGMEGTRGNRPNTAMQGWENAFPVNM